MAKGGFYHTKIKVDWTSNTAHSQFKLWRKEVERILHGPLASKADQVKISHVFIWAGAHCEMLIEAKTNENPDLEINTPKKLLDTLAECLTHSTFFREAREDFYNLKQKSDENTTTYYSRIMELYRQAEFPDESNFLIVDKLIHGCTNKESRKKLMRKTKDVSVKDCLDLLREDESVEASMKRLDDACKVSAAYSRDPTRSSQKNGSRKKHQGHQHSKNADSDKQKGSTSHKCRWCGGREHPREKCLQEKPNAVTARRKDTMRKCVFSRRIERTLTRLV